MRDKSKTQIENAYHAVHEPHARSRIGKGIVKKALPKRKEVTDRIVKVARSPQGHVMIMYEANIHAEAHNIKDKLYAVMFNRLPCVNPGSREFAEMMWARHVGIYNMVEEPVKKGMRLPKRAASGSAVLARGRNVR